MGSYEDIALSNPFGKISASASRLRFNETELAVPNNKETVDGCRCVKWSAAVADGMPSSRARASNSVIFFKISREAADCYR